MEINTETKIMAVIGDPIDHSLSPFMHNHIIAENGYNAVYFPFRVQTEEGLKRFLRSAEILNFAGFNITMPHKQNIIPLLDGIDSEAEAYGAVNTVKIRDGKAYGYNTDVRGLFWALKENGAKLSGSRVMVIGAGGVAASLIRGASAARIRSITVLNRTLKKAEQLCEGLNYAQAMAQTPENMRSTAASSDLIINCTSLGMSGTEHDFSDLSFLDETDAFLCDLIYNPWETNFLRYGRERGLTTMNGMSMLICQGLISFEIFTDEKLDMRREYDRLLPLCEARLKKK